MEEKHMKSDELEANRYYWWRGRKEFPWEPVWVSDYNPDGNVIRAALLVGSGERVSMERLGGEFMELPRPGN